MSDSTIKITTAVDQGSLDKLGSALDHIIGKVRELMGMTKNSPLAGMFTVGNASAPAGTGAVHVPGATGASRAGGGGNPIEAAVTNSANAMKISAKGGVDAFKELNSAFAGLVSNFGGLSGQLITTLSRVHEAYRSIKSLAGGAGAPAGLAGVVSGAAGGGLPAASVVATAAQAQAGIGGLTRAYDGKALGARAGSVGSGIGGLTRAYDGKAFGALSPVLETVETGGGIGNAVGAAAGIGSLAGLTTGLLVGGAIVSAGLLASSVIHSGIATEQSRLSYRADEPFFVPARQASLGGMLGQSEQAMLGGDVAEVVAIERANKSKAMKGIRDGSLRKQKELEYSIKAPESYGEAYQSGGAAGWLGYGWSEVGALSNWAFGKAKFTDENKSQVERDRLLQQLPTVESDKINSLKEAARAADPVYMNRINNIVSQGVSDMTFSDAARISGKNVFVKDLGPDGKPIWVGDSSVPGEAPYTVHKGYWKGHDEAGVANFKATAEEHGWDPGAKAGMIQRMGQGGWGLHGQATEGMLSMVAGGMTNAPELYGAGEAYGGVGGGERFRRKIQGIVGSGGIDITAGTNLGELVKQAMGSGFFGSGAEGPGALMQALASAAYSGTTGGDMRAAKEMPGGLKAFGDMTTGSASRWQQALNWSAVMKVAPGLGYNAQAAMTTVDGAALLGALGSKGETGVPAYLKNQGWTKAMMAAVTKAETDTALSTYIDDGGADNATKRAVRKVQQYGWGLKGMKGTWREKRAIEDAASAALIGTEAGGETEASAKYAARIMSGVGPKLGDASGAYRSASKDSPAAAGAKYGGALGHVGATQSAEQFAEMLTHLDPAKAKAAVEARDTERAEAVKHAAEDDPKIAANNIRDDLITFANSIEKMVANKSVGHPGKRKNMSSIDD